METNTGRSVDKTLLTTPLRIPVEKFLKQGEVREAE